MRISPYAVNLHYFVSDHYGQSAVIEFIKEKMVHRSAEGLPINVLANTSYDCALKTVALQKGSGKSPQFENLSRFARATGMIEKYNG